jgi:hypothetical protein
LGDSLPQAVVRQLKEKMNTRIEQLKKEKRPGYEEAIKNQRKIFFKKYDHQLDSLPYGACHLRHPRNFSCDDEK